MDLSSAEFAQSVVKVKNLVACIVLIRIYIVNKPNTA